MAVWCGRLVRGPGRPIFPHLIGSPWWQTLMARTEAPSREEVKAHVAATADNYRTLAVECEQLAEGTAAPCAREGYRQAAQSWRRLADLINPPQTSCRSRAEVPKLD